MSSDAPTNRSLLSSLVSLSLMGQSQQTPSATVIKMDIDNFKQDLFVGGQQLEQMSHNFDRLQKVWGFGCWEWDFCAGRFSVFNSHLWRSMGYTEEDLALIDSTEGAMSFVHKDDLPAMSAALEDEESIGSTFEYSYRLRCKNGSYRWLHLRAASQRDDEDKLLFMSGVNYDITNEKYAEQSLRDNQALFQRILTSSNDGIWEWSRTDSRMSFSQGCWRLLGFSTEDNELGKRRHRMWRARIHPMDRPEFDMALGQALEQGIAIDVEYRIKNIYDEWIWIRTRGDVIYDGEGKVEYLSGANIDITELKRSEERLIAAKSLAEQANKAKSEFLSSMSHELRTPMNAIMGFAQLFDYADNITSEQRENISEINRAGHRLLDLINDVLELARIEAGKLQFSLEAIAIGPLIESVFGECHNMAREQGVNLNFEPHHLTNAFVRADQNGLKQAILSLVNYGIQSCRSGGRVIVSLVDTANDYLVISVRDNGRGIPSALQPDLFEPFGRKVSENHNEESTGIRLAICKQLVELMAGNLQYDSEEGVGTCFQIQLPLEKREKFTDKSNQANAIIRDSLNGFEVNTHLFADKCFLYIEDNHANISLLEQYFSQFVDLSFEIADESVLGLFKARNSKPDLIILDINMPGIDGYEVLTILKGDEETASIPVVALSAHATNEEINRALDAGFIDYLTKPVDVEQLTMIASSLVS